MVTQAEEVGMQDEEVGMQDEGVGMAEEVIIRIEITGTKTGDTVITITGIKIGKLGITMTGIMSKEDIATKTLNIGDTEEMEGHKDQVKCETVTNQHGKVRQNE